jgi:hypothetical protein
MMSCVGPLLRLSAGLLLGWTFTAGATEHIRPWHLSGFGTIGGIWLDDGAVFFNHPAKSRDRASRPDFDTDSRIGLQASLTLSDRADLTVQVMASENYRGTYEPRITWAYARVNVTPGMTLRGGKLRAPFFMHSDSLYVNYVHPWVRPPVEVYGLNPFSDLDGVDLLYQTRVGAFDMVVQPYYGKGRVRFPSGTARLDDNLGIRVGLEKGPLTIQFGHARGRLALRYGDPLFLLLRGQLGAAGRDGAVARLSGRGADARFDSIGFEWDDDEFLVIGEYARRSASRFISTADGAHITAAYRLGSVTPFVTIARQRIVDPVLRDDPTIPVLGPYLTSRNQSQRSATLGVRWDLHPKAALKAQWTRSRVDRRAWGAFFPDGDPTASSPAGRTIDMLSVSIDFIF